MTGPGQSLIIKGIKKGPRRFRLRPLLYSFSQAVSRFWQNLISAIDNKYDNEYKYDNYASYKRDSFQHFIGLLNKFSLVAVTLQGFDLIVSSDLIFLQATKTSVIKNNNNGKYDDYTDRQIHRRCPFRWKNFSWFILTRAIPNVNIFLKNFCITKCLFLKFIENWGFCGGLGIFYMINSWYDVTKI